jgi:hypothetical protein
MEIKSYLSEKCPICGEWHEIKYVYKTMPLMACEKMPIDKIVMFEPYKNNPYKESEPLPIIPITATEEIIIKVKK